MIQFADDRSFPRESGGVLRIAFEFQMRDFDCGDQTGLAVNRLEDRRHAAPLDEAGYLETPVENLTDFDFVAQPLSNLREAPLRSR